VQAEAVLNSCFKRVKIPPITHLDQVKHRNAWNLLSGDLNELQIVLEDCFAECGFTNWMPIYLCGKAA
jgi:hypothetical protein